jgi:hypothetical protein
MRQVTVTVADGQLASEPVVLDQYIAPFSVTYSAVTGTVEVTTTDPYPYEDQDFTYADFTWVTAPTGAPNGVGFLGQPFRAIRITGATGGDTLTVIQAGVR